MQLLVIAVQPRLLLRMLMWLWSTHSFLHLQKTKSDDKKRELRAELTRVQQQIKEEQARRQRQVLDVERRVRTPPIDTKLFACSLQVSPAYIDLQHTERYLS